MADGMKQITLEQVVGFLKQNPTFFLEQPEAIEYLQLSDSPEGTISLAQRQVERLQAKNQQLHEQLYALIDNARQNTELQGKVHELCLRLMDCTSLHELLPLLVAELKQQFNADEVAIRLFYGEEAFDLPSSEDNIQQLHIDDDRLKTFDKVLDKRMPVCGRLLKAQKTELFADQDDVRSAACIPIGYEPCAGLLAIASYEEDRFHSNMATDYLAFMGEVLMRLLRQFCHPNHDN